MFTHSVLLLNLVMPEINEVHNVVVLEGERRRHTCNAMDYRDHPANGRDSLETRQESSKMRQGRLRIRQERLGMRHEWKQARYAGNKVRVYFLSFLTTFVTQPLAS